MRKLKHLLVRERPAPQTTEWAVAKTLHMQKSFHLGFPVGINQSHIRDSLRGECKRPLVLRDIRARRPEFHGSERKIGGHARLSISTLPSKLSLLLRERNRSHRGT